jgi:anti-sigma factor RsiW
MSETQTDRGQFGDLLDDRDGVAVLVTAAVLAGLSAGWAGRSLLAGEPVAEQFWLVPVTLGLVTALYSQANDG